MEETTNMRPSWDSYFMSIAKLVATRATCDRAHVGCVLVKDKRILATGYNGALASQPSCDEVGHIMIDGHCQRAVHGEANSIAFSARYGVSTSGAIAYCTHFPCINCLKLLIASGIKEIVYGQPYRTEELPVEIVNGVYIRMFKGEVGE